MSPLAVHFGAGNIGRGFLGELYDQSGFHTVFVDVNKELVGQLNQRGEYPLRIVGEPTITKTIRNVSAVDGTDIEAVAEVIRQAEIVSTAVGVNVLSKIAKALAAGILKRDGEPLDVIVCENLLHAGTYLREQVEALGVDTSSVGFVEASVGRMVPVMTPEQRAEDPLLVCVEAFNKLPVDAEAFHGRIPAICNLQPTPHFEAYVERKLFVHNAGHATAAYLGHLRGHTFIWESMEDPLVRPVVEGAMAESCKGLSRRHGMNWPELRAHAEDLAQRFANRALGDTTMRVGADPVRKLGPHDRLVGALRMCEEEGVESPCLCMATAAALRFDTASDPSSARVRELGPAETLRTICEIDPESDLGKSILDAQSRLDLLTPVGKV